MTETPHNLLQKTTPVYTEPASSNMEVRMISAYFQN